MLFITYFAAYSLDYLGNIPDGKWARLFSVGLLMMVISEILDVIGIGFGKWSYQVKVIP